MVTVLAMVLMGGASVPALAAERDPMTPRVPTDQLAAARQLENPIPYTSESVGKGQKIYRGRGSCNVCHGETGQGDGIGGPGLDPSPRNLTNTRWQSARTDGELMWVLKNGSPGTPMITVVPGLISEQDGWHLINFLRSLVGR